MQVLVAGGSGYVGSITLPWLAAQHRLRIFDLQPPKNASWEYVPGDVGDIRALRQAADGMDALLYMAMGSHADPPNKTDWEYDDYKASSFDVNVKGLYLALDAARKAGITHAVYTSSLSVYQDFFQSRYITDEDLPTDARGLYGFTKRLGEEVCRNAAREWGMSINALRLCLPVPAEKWFAEVKPGEPTLLTTAEDTARALLAALELRAGFQAFTISGDYEQKKMSLAKARRMLGWEPLARPSRE